jgi:PleD family two-component response regulator
MPPELTNEGETARVLIVDGEKARIDSLRALLEQGGYQCCCAATAFEAGFSIGQFRPDLVLLDLEMPGVEAGTFVSTLRQNEESRNLPVLLVASAKDLKAQRRAKAAGLSLVCRPLDPDELRGRVEKMLRERPAA